MNGMRVLLIEDDDDLRSMVCEQLVTLGHTVLEAAGGTEGLRKVKAEHPDVVITDIMMPDLSGFDVLAEIRRDRQTRLLPVIMATGKGDREDIRRGMNLGADDYIIKPFSIHELDASIRCQGRRRAFVDEMIGVWELRSLTRVPQELRTPLNGILGISEYLRQSVLEGITLSPREWCDNLDVIRSAGYRLFRLIENHLLHHELSLAGLSHRYRELYRGQSTRLPGDPADWQEKAREFGRSADFSMNLEPADIPMGEELWSKLVKELLDNAFKFSAVGSPVSLTGRCQPSSYLLEVSDGGIGLATGEDAAGRSGTGLGLAIVRMAVALHDGHFELKPVSGDNGTLAQVRLPRTGLPVR